MDDLIDIKNIIENMNQIQQLEIFKILKMNNVDYNENKNGIFINLTNVNPNIIKELKKYIKYVEQQNTYLNKQETQKKIYLDNYFKENTNNIVDDGPAKVYVES